ncbi:hypothetical protein [Streptomyces griseus]|uniref:hypothetical protein n=1 Tax=Streptomyces griseus TaxID=1911 RepID=UPI000A3C59E0|nr:hypothetical protein [Streptomyces fimicarius]
MATSTPVPDPGDDEDVPVTLAALRALLEEFSDLPDDTPVILQKDVTGERVSPLAGAAEAMYVDDVEGSAEAFMTPEQIAADPAYTEEDEAPEDAVRAIVLWPLG